ncbi:hypothetical protein K438DRAFT_2055178 [Mycena galopus ATCC 62051]|nr:hypothetical protein K438DRAFT_2055178 [Mycena galopus ATCC 62051]
MSDELSKTKRKKAFGTEKLKKDTEDMEEVAHPALKEHELFKKIEKDHYCQACKTACVVLDSGEHHILTHTELATWAMLASRHQATLDGVPSQLGLDINHAQQQRAKNHRNKLTASFDSPMEWIQALTPVVEAFFNNRGPPMPDWQHSPQNIGYALGSDPRNQPQPSSLGKHAAEDAPAQICPEIVEEGVGRWVDQSG